MAASHDVLLHCVLEMGLELGKAHPGMSFCFPYQPLSCYFHFRKHEIYLRFISFSTTQMTHIYLKTFPIHGQGLFIFHSQYHDGWCHGHQGISCNGIGLICGEYSDFSIRRVNPQSLAIVHEISSAIWKEHVLIYEILSEITNLERDTLTLWLLMPRHRQVLRHLQAQWWPRSSPVYVRNRHSRATDHLCVRTTQGPNWDN